MKMNKQLNLVLKYTIPSVIALLVNSIYIIVDGFFVIKGVGETALAAVTLSVPFLEGLIAVSMLVSVGAGIYISNYLGQGKKEKANEILNISFFILILISALISVIGLIFIEKLAYFLGANKEMLDLVCGYLKYLLYFTPSLILSYALATYLRNDNNPNLGMIGMVAGGIINIFLDYIFIFILNMGIEGAGLATGLGSMFSVIIMFMHFILKKGDLYFKIIKFNFRILKKITIAGMPAFITEYSLGIVTYLHNYFIIKNIGEQGVAIYGIVGYIALIVLTLFLGTAQGIQPLISLSYGGKKYKDLKLYIKITFIIILFMGIISTAIIFLFSESIVSVFTGNNINLTKKTVEALNIYSINFIAAGINIFIISLLQSIKKPKEASIMAIFRSTILVIVMLIILPKFLGSIGIWLVMPLVEILNLIIVFFLLLKKRKEFYKKLF